MIIITVASCISPGSRVRWLCNTIREYKHNHNLHWSRATLQLRQQESLRVKGCVRNCAKMSNWQFYLGKDWSNSNRSLQGCERSFRNGQDWSNFLPEWANWPRIFQKQMGLVNHFKVGRTGWDSFGSWWDLFSFFCSSGWEWVRNPSEDDGIAPSFWMWVR